ncbi:SH3 domain-binding protein 5-like isoform X2 [Uloborus diversus]|uniref:SH3 domain-binding protein 5-like isoform X2 n=1 Tax=Uloborus diversus TaxID=327109 RepID=UPI002409196D|nr:SH3 domain-binding protein 5-like isoform X2 [Uloborus diversus]
MSNGESNHEKIEIKANTAENDCISREESVDPRVQVELERLNTATDLINKLEIELDEARSNFRLLLSESSLRVNQLAKKLGSCVEKARPYYESRMQAKQLQSQTQKAALRYERASSAHSAAKEMVFLAEEGLKKEGRCFDPAWQEMLNHATLRVNEAESERVLSQHEHQKTSLAYNEAEKIVQQLHQELKKSIVKSRPYFEMKAQFNQLLEEQRKKVHRLEENVLKIKMSYADALHNLEEISDEIHQKRKAEENQRSEGVGAESPTFVWDGLNIPYHKIPRSSTSCEDIFLDNLNSEDVYMSLPPKLKARPSVIAATCKGNISQAEKLKSSSNSTCQGSSVSKSLNGIQSKHSSNGPLSPSEKIKNGVEAEDCVTLTVDDSNTISNYFEQINLADNEEPAASKELPEIKDRSPEGQEMADHKFLAPDFNILRVQREELSDSESLASNDTADTLDDNQIECLLLEKVLPLDVENDIDSPFTFHDPRENSEQ